MAFKYIIGDTETDKATEASLLDGNGPYTHTVALGAAGGVNWLHIIPGDSSPYVHFFGTYNSTSNPTYNDNVFHLGHNVNAGGGAVEAGKGVLSDAWESYFNGGHIQQERHLKWVDVDGYETRFISFEGHLDDGSTDLFIDSTNIRLGSGRNANTPPSLSIAPTITTINSPDGYNIALFDQDANGYVRLQAGSPVAGNDRASLQISANGQVNITTRFIGTLQDATAVQSQYYWDATNTIIQSPDSTSAKMIISNGAGPIFYVNGVAALLAQSNQIFVNGRLLYVQRDNIQNSARGDIWGSFLARNTTAATNVVTQQFSPPIVQTGYGWTGSANRAVSFQTQVQPDGLGDGKLIWGYTNDEANYAEIAALTTVGDFLPGVSGTPSIGSSSKKWKDGYFNGTVTLDGYAKLAATVGTWVEGPNLQGVDATNSNFIKYTPNDAGTTSWYQWASSFANGGGRRNQVMRFGWNVAGGGGRVTTGANNGALASEYEQYFEGGHNQMERHETFVDTDGYQTRWLSFAGALDDGTTSLYVRASAIDIGSGRNSSDPAHVVITSTNTRVYSPNNFNYLWTEDSMMWLQAGTTGTAKTKITFDPAGDLTLYAKRGFIQDGYNELLLQWQASGGVGTGAIWMRSPDDSTELYVDNGGFQLIAGGIMGVRHTGTALTLNNGTAGITMNRSGSRAFQFGDASNAARIYGADNNAYLSLANGVTGALLADVNEKIAALDSQGIVFTTNNVERARFDYSAFRPSTNGMFKLGDNGAAWSETWTISLNVDGYNIDPSNSVSGQALVYNGSAYVPTKIGGTYNVTAVKTSTYVAVDKDLVQCNPSGGGFTVTLPPVSTSLTVVVKNITNSTNTITINPDGSDTIDGTASTSITTAYGVMTFYSDAGTNWIVI